MLILKKRNAAFPPESFIEVSEEEFKEKDDDVPLGQDAKTEGPAGFPKSEAMVKEVDESVGHVPAAAPTSEEDEDDQSQHEDEVEQGTETTPSSPPAADEWEDMDVVSWSCYLYIITM